jgi:hypothetical protein
MYATFIAFAAITGLSPAIYTYSDQTDLLFSTSRFKTKNRETLEKLCENAIRAIVSASERFLGIVPLSAQSLLQGLLERHYHCLARQKAKAAHVTTHSIVDSGKALFKPFLIAIRLK